MEGVALKTSGRQVIWVCRHGNRIDFVDPSWKGNDPHLSPDGVLQAKETGLRLRNEGIQHIFASPFLRTAETAHYIAEALDLSVEIEHGACEWLNPAWFSEPPTYVSPDALRSRFPRIDSCHRSVVTPEYPESSEESLARAGETACTLADTHRGNILIIGHGHSVCGMIWGLLGNQCSVSPGLCSLAKIIRQDGSVRLELNCDSSHLSSGDAHRDRLN